MQKDYSVMPGAPSHYEVTLTDQLPPPAQKTLRVAERLSYLPVELVEPIIQDLPLSRILELLSVPTCGPSLERAIEYSPTWSWAFTDGIVRWRRVWASLNRLSWIWCRLEYTSIPALSGWRHFGLTSPELKARFDHWGHYTNDMPRLAAKVHEANDYAITSGVRRILGCDLYNVRPSVGKKFYFGFSVPQMRAFCLFLPPTIVSAITKKSSHLLLEALKAAEMPESVEDCLSRAEYNAVDIHVSSGDLSRHDLWTTETAHRFLPFLARAYKLLKEAYSAELLSILELHEQFPGMLKPPFAPQTPPKSSHHVAVGLRRDAQAILTKPLRSREGVYIHPNSKQQVFTRAGSHRFRYPDTALIPFDWCFILFMTVRCRLPPRYPEQLLPALKEAEAGLRTIYHRNAQETYAHLLKRVNEDWEPNNQRLNAILAKHPDYTPFLHYVGGAPRSPRELSWLKSFLTCVEWMKQEFGELASACQALGSCKNRLAFEYKDPFNLFTSYDYERFINAAPAELVAVCLQRDSWLSDKGDPAERAERPSKLALHLPEFSSPRGRDIARYLLANAEDAGIEAQELKYDSLRAKIARRLKKKAPEVKGHADGYSLVCEMTDEGMENGAGSQDYSVDYDAVLNDALPPSSQVAETDVDIASKVLRNLLESSLQPGASAADALEMLNKLRISTPTEADEPPEPAPTTWDDTVKKYLKSRPAHSLPGNDGLRRCYICRLALHVPHKCYPSLCVPCGEFNAAGSRLSLPDALNLSGKTALVTGARVNLGYHVALRLLRCGARVVASTRYPQDAVARYQAEEDSGAWIDRLRVVGADFRSARDAFELVRHTREIIAGWGDRLDILVNNAAQTLTDRVETETRAVQREKLLEGATASPTPLLLQQAYQPRVRGGAQALIAGPASDFTKDLVAADDRSSWVQSLSDIPYEDVISAHSVNTFVPLILIRELLPIMGNPTSSQTASSTPTSSQDSPTPPEGYILNISSREGIFEPSPSNPHKAGRHVHTNMSKAGLNMITETEAGPAWKGRRVAINTVDPGYMSAAPELEDAYGGVRPIGWEDGAARVLWPVAVGEGAAGTRRQVVWGRFLKHYGAVGVEVGLGRG